MAQRATKATKAPTKRSSTPAVVRALPADEPPPAFSPHFQAAIEMIGQRWTGAIIRALLSGTNRFSDIRDSVPQLSDRLLWERLKTLEEQGLIERLVVNRRHTEYTLTEKGKALEPVVKATSAWAQKWLAPQGSRRARPRAPRRSA